MSSRVVRLFSREVEPEAVTLSMPGALAGRAEVARSKAQALLTPLTSNFITDLIRVRTKKGLEELICDLQSIVESL